VPVVEPDLPGEAVDGEHAHDLPVPLVVEGVMGISAVGAWAAEPHPPPMWPMPPIGLYRVFHIMLGPGSGWTVPVILSTSSSMAPIPVFRSMTWT